MCLLLKPQLFLLAKKRKSDFDFRLRFSVRRKGVWGEPGFVRPSSVRPSVVRREAQNPSPVSRTKPSRPTTAGTPTVKPW